MMRLELARTRSVVPLLALLGLYACADNRRPDPAAPEQKSANDPARLVPTSNFASAADVPLVVLQSYTTDFSTYALGVQPAGWSVQWDTTDQYKVNIDSATPGNQVLQWNASGESRNRWGLSYDGFGSVTDQEVLTEFRVRTVNGGTTAYYLGSAAVRISGTSASENGYALMFFHSAASPGYAVLATWEDGAYQQLGSQHIGWQFDTWYSVRLQAVRNRIRGRIWPRGTAEPTTWLFDVLDSRYSSGRPGVSHHDNSNVQWDRWTGYVVQDTTTPPPPASVVRIGLTPDSPTLQSGRTQQFVATAFLSDSTTRSATVTFSATGGTITSNGLYTAGATPGDYRVIATDVSGLADTSTIRISPAPPPPPPPGGTGTHAYIVAHEDDWQIFMGDRTWTSLNTAAKVVFVFLTAGDAGRDSSYWRIRERGAEASIDTLFAGNWSCVVQTVSSRPLRRCSKGKVVYYYLRLPDGNSGDGLGFGFGSLRRLKENATPLSALDGSTVYPSFSALGTTVRSILDLETPAGQIPVVHAPDYDRVINLADHPDHLLTGDVTKIAQTGRTWGISLYIGYPTQGMPANLDAYQNAIKEQTFVAYERAIGIIGIPPGYLVWLPKTYVRTDPTPAPPTVARVVMTPDSVSAQTGTITQFNATALMSDGTTSAMAMTYTATGGTVTSAGAYTAGATAGSYSVIAVEPGSGLADTSKVTLVPPPPPWGVTFESTFAETATGVLPAGWVETAVPANSDWTVFSNSLAADGRSLRNVTTSTGRHILRYSAVADTTTWQEVLVKMRVTANNDRGPGVALRHTMAANGTENAYVAYLRPAGNQVEINAFVAGGWNLVAGRAMVIDPNIWYWVRFRAQGSTLTLNVWPDGTTEPTTPAINVANTLLAAGGVGLYTYEPNTTDYDVFSAATGSRSAPTPVQGPPPPPPTLTRVVLTPDTATVTALGNLQFQANGLMSDGSSQPITTTYTATGGTVNSAGLYTAGSTVGSYRVIATEAGGRADTSSVTIVPAPVLTRVTMTPESVTVLVGGSASFAVTGTLSNGSTTTPSVNYTATGGTITSAGVFTAGAATGSFRVIATAAASPVADTSTITIIPVPPSLTYQTSFVDMATLGHPGGWTETSAPNGSAWSVERDAGVTDTRLLRNVTTSAGRHILRYDAIPTTSTVQEVLVKMRFADIDDRGAGIALRHTMNGSVESAFVAYFRPGIDQVEINAFVNGGWSSVGSRPFVNDPGVWYWMRFRAEGTTLSLRAWADGTAEPTAWTFTAISSSLPNGGVGLYTYEANTVDYDAFSVTNNGSTAPTPNTQGPPPVLTISRIVLSPDSAVVNVGATQQFQSSALMSDGSSESVSVTYTTTGGTISPTGLFSAAGSTVGTYQIVATAATGAADTSRVRVITPPNYLAFQTTFATDALGVEPAGWFETANPANSSYSVVADPTVLGGQILRNVTTSTTAHILRYGAAADTTTTQEVLIRIRVGDSDDRGPGAALRHTMSPTGGTNAYVAYLRPGPDMIEINAFVNNGWQFVANGPFVNNPGQWYWIRFRAEGTTMRARAWADGTAEPATWNITGTNAALTAGSVGLYTYEANTVDYSVFSMAAGGLTALRPTGY